MRPPKMAQRQSARIAHRSISKLIIGSAIFALTAGSVFASGTPTKLNLPPTPVYGTPNVTPGGTTYLAVNIANAPSGYDVGNGNYLGWCIDAFGTLEFSIFTLYDSYGGVGGDTNPAIPPLDNLAGQAAWNEVNWLINNPKGNNNDVPTATATDVQQAIWYLLDPFWVQTHPLSSLSTNVQTLISDAQANPMFVSMPGQYVAVILYADGILPTNTANVQDIFIQIPVPGGTPPCTGCQCTNSCPCTVTNTCPPVTPPDVYEVNYFRNKNGMGTPDDIIDIVNPGTSGGNLCAMIYVIYPDEEMSECCGCLITPNQLIELGVQANLTQNPATSEGPAHNGAIKLIKSAITNPGATGNAQCNPGAPVPTPTLNAWMLHTKPLGNLTATPTEVPFLYAPLSPAEENLLATTCSNIRNDLSGHGICTCPATLPM